MELRKYENKVTRYSIDIDSEHVEEFLREKFNIPTYVQFIQSDWFSATFEWEIVETDE